MASYEHRIITVTRHEWVVPATAGNVMIDEFHKAYGAAEHQAEALGININSGDWLKVTGDDTAIVLWFETDGSK